MQMPIYQVPWLGNGMVIALDAVLHVCISHGLAIGAFAMLLLAEGRRRRVTGPLAEGWERFDLRLLKLIVVVTTTVGAVTGAGIWFVTGTLAARGISSMLRVFFWPWWIEWIVFVLEVTILLVIWFLWDRLRERPPWRVWLGLGYLGLVSMSGVLISGILAFMLTPGDWPMGRRLGQAWFNPTFPPQLVFRLVLAAYLGSLIALAVASLSRLDAALKADAVRLFGKASLVLLPLLVAVGAWYAAVTPDFYMERLVFSVVTGRLIDWAWALSVANGLALAVFVVLGLAAWRRRVRLAAVLVVPALLLGVGVVSEFERVREFIRGPFLMPGHMWVSGVLMQETPLFDREGLLPHSPWYSRTWAAGRPHAEGAFLFARNCAGCHTVNGLNGITQRMEGRSEEGIYVLIGRTSEMVSFMNPFSGTDEERRALARYLYDVTRGEVPMDSRARFEPARTAPEPPGEGGAP